MKNKVLWSELAQETYLGILEYYQAFSQSAAEDLEAKVIALTDRLAEFKYLCPPAPNLPRYRKCVNNLPSQTLSLTSISLSPGWSA